MSPTLVFGNTVDSLKHILSTTQEACEKARLCNLISGESQLHDAAEALRYAEKALDEAKRCPDKLSKGRALLNMASAFDLSGKYSEALKNALKARKIFENQGAKKELAVCLHRLGVISYHQSETTEGTNKTGFYESALRYYDEAYSIEKERGNELGMLDNKIEIAYVKFNMGDADTALSILNEALRISLKHPDNNNYIHNVAKSSYNISLIHIARDSLELAISYLAKAVAADSILGNKEGLAGIRLAELYMLSGDNITAIEFAKRYYDTALTYGYKLRQKQASDVLYRALAGEGDFDQAYHYLLINKSLGDSLRNEDHIKEMTTLELNYEFEKKQKQKDAERKAEIERTNRIIYGGLVVLLIIIIIAYLNYRNYRAKQRNNERLQMAYHIIEEKNHDILGSIRYAKRIQEAILPPPEMAQRILMNSFILFRPKDVVSGDFYWMEKTKDGCAFAVVDCTGHGVPGAFMSIIGHNALHRAVNEFKMDTAGSILDKMNELVEETLRQKGNTEIRDGMDISLCVVKNKKGKKILEFAGANNSLYVLVEGAITELKANKQPIGAYEKKTPFTTQTLEITGKETVYLFTDGYADQFGGEKGKKFMYRSFKELLVSIEGLPLSEQKKILDERIDSWKGNFEQIDDICVMGVKLDG